MFASSIRKVPAPFAITLLFLSALNCTAQGSVPFRLDKVLQAPKAGQEGWFGNSVAMDASRIIIGEAFGDVGTTKRAGRAYVFALNGDLLHALQSPSPRKEGSFGGEEYCNKLVAIGDNCWAVGETRAQGGGKTYLFKADGSVGASLASTEPLRGNKEFGNSLAMTAELLLVGSYNSGAFLYDASGNLIASLKAEGGAAQDGFGMATAICGDTIVVTQDHALVAGVRDAGKAYIYNAHGELMHSICAADPVQPALFGVSAATSGDLVVIGAPEASVEGRARAGLVYVFTADGKLDKVLSAPVPTLYFGVSVAVEENRIIVGASGTKVGDQNGAGQAFIFDRGGACLAALQSPKPSAGANFGWSVASGGGTIAVSAPGEEVEGKAAAGRVYLFTAP